VLSLDDLYLTRNERQQLAQQVHPLLLTRGVPGTHDVALGIRLLNAFGGTRQVTLPSFDKATDDRRPDAAWLQAPIDVVLFEGWFVGAKPQSERALETSVNELERLEDPHGTWRRFVNDALRDRYQQLFDWIDTLVLLQARDFNVVYRWRSEQEAKLRERVEAEEKTASGLMDENALRRFVAHYERLTRHVLEEMPSRADIVIELDDARVPTRVLGLPPLSPASRHP
jgi:D-glycerate 3-kinase